MHIEYHKRYSTSLNRDMEFKIYGHAGIPFIVFPSSGGDFSEYEDFGMIHVCRDFIESGQIRFFTPDSLDQFSWLDKGASMDHKNHVHSLYEHYIMNEFVPLLQNEFNIPETIGVTGCSIGGYHALNFYLKHPGVFNISIAQSGIYDARFFTDGQMNGNVYYNSPVDYMKNMSDSWYFQQYNQGHIIISTGLGAWEEDTIRDTDHIAAILSDKQIPAWVDYWGHDVDHDWPWWRVQMPYFLEQLHKQGVI